ncbi:MAG: HlyC/CorC family transporter [Dechloromonas sp.]|nr:MAG: HlyC/CorC family transporter [Dechloromonas sp.]
MLENTLIILLLIVISAFCSTSEIALSAARKLKLAQLAERGDPRAATVLALQSRPGHFFTTIQIGLNAVAILAGVLGEGAYSPWFTSTLQPYVGNPATAATLGSILSFALVTAAFVLLADLLPKRVAIVAPEAIALRIAAPMAFCIRLLSPLVWAFNGAANLIMARFGLPESRPEDVTPADIVALTEAGMNAGVVAEQEQQLIENVFELESRTAPSLMTARDSIVWLDSLEDEAAIRAKLRSHPHAKFPVCAGNIDAVVGYVDSKDILNRILNGDALSLKAEGLLRSALILPDTLTLGEILEQFKSAREDFALIINEYALIVGLITLNDVTATLVGDTLDDSDEAQIIRRDENSWLVDGLTPVGDLETLLDIPPFPDDEQFETVAGFLMYVLRKVPRPTESVDHGGFRFEVLDVDHHRIDQLLVTRLDPKAP